MDNFNEVLDLLEGYVSAHQLAFSALCLALDAKTAARFSAELKTALAASQTVHTKKNLEDLISLLQQQRAASPSRKPRKR
jgi:hypothetical protein